MCKKICNYSNTCMTDRKHCLNCTKFYEKFTLQDYYKPYIPTCPRGYTDCVNDPAYIKYYHEEWYKDIYGELTPYEAAEKCRKAVEEDPDEEFYCYDDEDK